MGAWFQLQNVVAAILMLGIGLLAVFVEAAPLGLSADSRPSPDLVYCLVAFLAIRRPEAVPLAAVFLLGLARDLLTDVPAGLGTLTLVAVSEFLRFVSPLLARRGFATQWAAAALLFAVTLALQWLVVLLLLWHPPYVSDLGQQWLITAALYPAVALLLRGVFRTGGRKTAPAARG